MDKIFITYKLRPMVTIYSESGYASYSEVTTEDDPKKSHWSIFGIKSNNDHVLLADCFFKESAEILLEALMKPIKEKENYLSILNKYKKD